MAKRKGKAGVEAMREIAVQVAEDLDQMRLMKDEIEKERKRRRVAVRVRELLRMVEGMAESSWRKWAG